MFRLVLRIPWIYWFLFLFLMLKLKYCQNTLRGAWHAFIRLSLFSPIDHIDFVLIKFSYSIISNSTYADAASQIILFFNKTHLK